MLTSCLSRRVKALFEKKEKARGSVYLLVSVLADRNLAHSRRRQIRIDRGRRRARCRCRYSPSGPRCSRHCRRDFRCRGTLLVANDFPHSAHSLSQTAPVAAAEEHVKETETTAELASESAPVDDAAAVKFDEATKSEEKPKKEKDLVKLGRRLSARFGAALSCVSPSQIS